MTVPTIFETCRPRPDILEGTVTVTEADFAADLAQVITGEGTRRVSRSDTFLRQHVPDKGSQESA